jgi:hypothetical protein
MSEVPFSALVPLQMHLAASPYATGGIKRSHWKYAMKWIGMLPVTLNVLAIIASQVGVETLRDKLFISKFSTYLFALDWLWPITELAVMTDVSVIRRHVNQIICDQRHRVALELEVVAQPPCPDLCHSLRPDRRTSSTPHAVCP